MQTSATSGAAAGLLSPPEREPTNQFAELTSEEFMNLILTELSNQDPTQPQDTQALLDQVGTLVALESDSTLTDQLGSLVDESAFSTSAALIGSEVTGVTDGGETVTDIVISVARRGDETLLKLADGTSISHGSVTEIGLPLIEEAPPPDNTDDSEDGEGTDNEDGDEGEDG